MTRTAAPKDNDVSVAGAYAPEGARQGWTPGPWVAAKYFTTGDKEDWFVRTEDGATVVSGLGHSKENMMLAARAPELLDQLVSAQKALYACFTGNVNASVMARAAYDKNRALLSKLKGSK